MYRKLLDDPDSIDPVLKVIRGFLPEDSELDDEKAIWNALIENLNSGDFTKMHKDVICTLAYLAE